MNFELKSEFKPTGDQPQAIEKLYNGVKNGERNQVLLGVTGSGKTFTMANVIQKLQKPTLIISHNKTLAAQLYQEFRDFFPDNAVSYFVSYYDFYQPEAYLPQTDTYIEKETEINEEIDKLRLASTTNILTRKDTIVIASVSCIYNLGSPREYGHFVLETRVGERVSRESIFARLVNLQYTRSDYGFHRSTFRVRGEIIDLFPAYEDNAVRIHHDGIKINKMEKIDPLSGKKIDDLDYVIIYPAKHYMTDASKQKDVLSKIEEDLSQRVFWFKKQGKLVEAQRLNQKVHYDLEMIQEIGYVNGIENYSRYFDGRNPGDPPYTLLDYFHESTPNNFLVIIDESHNTVPQIRGMYNGDRSRKQTLIDFGFRLPAAFDNRPLTFQEFYARVPQLVYVSATPDEWEINISKNHVVEQLIRPTGIPDPQIIIKPTRNQVEDLIVQIREVVQKRQRVLVTTLTKKTAEALSTYLKEKGFNVHYLHSDVQTLERSDILDDLRLGKYDVLVGINLLREGLDLPEVSLVAILDADKEGFLRSKTTLIQTMGRAARHIEGKIILYADRETRSIKEAIKEVSRRRNIQLDYNTKHHITPRSIIKPIREKLVTERDLKLTPEELVTSRKIKAYERLLEFDTDQLLPSDRTKLIRKLSREMRAAAEDLNFELAAAIRDKVRELLSL
ncbi:excinuclease ABC subunit UvrB [Candidatus Gottesmanbacteria bacterium]|nr:excinuclease ABC subunit UvrB [Candidatus Gottesmanbacteria bacterium]